jgi:hypothetical protein
MNAQQNQVNRQIGANLDEQQKQIDMFTAQDEARRQAILEQRHNQNVAALSSQVASGQQNMMQGVSGALQGVSSMAQMSQEQANFDKSLDAYKGSSFSTPQISYPTMAPMASFGSASPSYFNGYQAPINASLAGFAYPSITTNAKPRQ